ncbi:MAG: hypothetical protein IKZ04_02175 [Spirochaetaceae bacterium]|nr:hypothetical protein [Spirochaetaceae bacterium]
MKKISLFVFTLFLLFSCSNDSSFSNSSNDEVGGNETGRYGTIVFFNESSYSVNIHKDAFSGPVIAELSSGQSKSIKVNASENYGIGSTFSIGFKTRVIDEIGLSCGEVYAYGIDPNMQLNLNVEEGKKYTLQIPQPSNLVYETAFLKIINASSMPFELTKSSVSFKQAGNGVLSVPSGEIGVYEIPSSTVGIAFENYKLKSVFESYDVPSFFAQHSKIYNFTFDGTSVSKTGEESIVY